MIHSGFDVVVIGNVGIDTNVYLLGSDIDFGVESNFTENIDCVGQAGGYASRGYAQLGKKTAFIGHLGDDYNGHFVRQEMASDDIDLGATFVDPEGTARSVNFMYQDGRRKNFYDGKGHMGLMPDLDVCRATLSGAKLAHFSIPNWARHLLPIARELEVTIACDIQDVVSVDDDYRWDFIEQADILFFSAANQTDPAKIMTALLQVNPDQIMIAGMGAEGCAIGTQHGIDYFSAVEMEAPVIDTNGAGDSLAVGFLSSLVLDGYSARDAVLRGQIAARHACTLKANSSDLIGAARLESLFEELKQRLDA